MHNPSTQYKVLRLVDSKLTANLLKVEDGAIPIDNAQRRHFNPTLDYTLKNDGEPTDPTVAGLYRDNQLSSFQHVCTSCCYKYNKNKHSQICRFAYPRQCSAVPAITETRTKGCGRMRLRVEPQRNHDRLNPTHRSPLVVVAQGSNADFQYICDERGAVEYW